VCILLYIYVYYYHFNGVQTHLRDNCVHECRGYLNKYILFKRTNCIWFSFERDAYCTHASYGSTSVRCVNFKRYYHNYIPSNENMLPTFGLFGCTHNSIYCKWQRAVLADIPKNWGIVVSKVTYSCPLALCCLSKMPPQNLVVP